MASSDIQDEKAIGEFLSDINCLDEIEDKLGKENVFDVLGATRNEIRHSRVLCWLLDPNGTHGLGELFLRTFLQHLVKLGANPVKLLSANLDSFYVRPEYKHIDILIVSKENKIAIAIENKVDSGEHDNQLARYKATVESDFSDFYQEFIFLTPDGADASDDVWRSLGYDNIYEALVYCLDRMNVGSEVNLILTQYLNLLKREFMNRTELMEICNRIYRQHKQALDLIFEMREDSTSETFLMVKKWFAEHPKSGLVIDENHSCKTYIRFTTAWLVVTVPPLKDGKKSGWKSDKSVYYEVVNRENGLSCKLTISSENLDSAIFGKIKKSFSKIKFKKVWSFKTLKSFCSEQKLRDDDSIDQVQVNAFMDRLTKELQDFEKKMNMK